MNITTLENNIYDWLSVLISPTPVIWLNDNGPRPNTTGYISLRHNAFEVLGIDGYKHLPDDEENISIEDDIEFMLMVTGYYSNGKTAIFTIFEALSDRTKLTALSNNNICIVDNEGILDVTELLDNRYEVRSALDIRMRTIGVHEYESEIIETVNINLKGYEGEVLKINEQITVEQED